MDLTGQGSSDFEKFDILRKMEDEHLRLQRQVRLIQTDRQNRTFGVHPQFRRQDRLLRRLKKEYINMGKDLKIARSGVHKKRDKRMKVDLKNALINQNQIETDCEGGVNLMEELEGLIKNNMKHTMELRSQVTVNMGEIEERRTQGELRLMSTENQLETAMLRFNTVQFENQKIRQEIDHMLKDRANFNLAWSNLLAVLTKGKKFLSELIESSTVAYDQREEIVTKLKSVQEKGKTDQCVQIQEMRDTQKALDHEAKLYEFLSKKGVKRVNLQQEKREVELKEKEKESINKEIEHHQEILDEIFSYTEVEEIENIIRDFELREQHNFSIYRLLTDVCAETIVLTKDVDLVRRDVVDRRDWNENLDFKRTSQLQKLAEVVENHQKVTDELKEKVQLQEELLNRTTDKIAGIFQMLDCSLEPFENLLGDKGPSRWHFNLTMSLITEKINELIQLVYYSEHSSMKKKEPKSSGSRLKRYTLHLELPEQWTPTPLSYYVPADPCPSCVEARWMSKISEIPEEPFTKAMSLEALKQLTEEPAYLRTDRLHTLADCRLPASRLVMARRYM